jgi:hypothetical protein
MTDRDIEDANWAADAVERMLCRICRQLAADCEAVAARLRWWAR